MSRRLDRVRAVLTSGAFGSVLTVPAGHKYEVVTVTFSGDSTVAYTFYLAVATAAGLTFADEKRLAVGFFGTYDNFEALVLFEGEQLYVGCFPAAGVHPGTTLVNFVDVYPV